MRNLLEDLKKIVGEENFWADYASRLAYAGRTGFGLAAQPEALPLAVAKPLEEYRLARLLAFCSQRQIPLLIRGNGCMPFADLAPGNPGSLIVLTTGFNRIYEVEEAGRSIQAGCGASCARVQAAAARHGLYCPGLPRTGAPVTVGGVLAMNEAPSGFGALGAPADYLAMLEAYTMAGVKMRLHAVGAACGCGRGFPAPQLFCGSEGALVFMKECCLRLLPLPAGVVRLAGLFQDLPAALKAVGECLNVLSLPLSQLALCNPDCCQALLPTARGWLIYAEYIASGEEELAPGLQRLGEALDLPPGQVASIQDGLPLLPTLLAREKGAPRLFQYVCPPGKEVEMFMGDVEQIVAKFGLSAAFWADPAVGRVKVAIFEPAGRLEEALDAFFALELMANGRMEAEEEAHMGRAAWQESHADMAASLLEAVAHVCDPQGILRARRVRWGKR